MTSLRGDDGLRPGEVRQLRPHDPERPGAPVGDPPTAWARDRLGLPSLHPPWERASVRGATGQVPAVREMR